MKRILFAALLSVAFSTASFTREFVGSGPTHSSLGDYKIETTDPVIINGEQFKAYVISYQNSPMEVTVVVKKDKECKKFIVLSEKLSVQYVCNESYFGVQKLDKSLQKDGYSTSDALLDRNEYFHQKKIAPGKREEVDNAHLIAAYFPRLISNPEVFAKQ